jgi:hypothetical protein
MPHLKKASLICMSLFRMFARDFAGLEILGMFKIQSLDLLILNSRKPARDSGKVMIDAIFEGTLTFGGVCLAVF